MRCEHSGWYTIVAVFEVKKEIPAERLIHGELRMSRHAVSAPDSARVQNLDRGSEWRENLHVFGIIVRSLSHYSPLLVL
jgi:hypothetical protein